MLRNRRNEIRALFAGALCLCFHALTSGGAERLVLHLKNGDRISGTFVSDNTNGVSVGTSFGTLVIPSGEIARREVVPITNAPPVAVGTNAPAAAAGRTNKPPAKPKPPLTPANPEALPIASTPHHWKHDLRFGLNLRYAEKDSQEFLVIGKSTYGKPPFRHIFDVNFKYGHTDGALSANSLVGSEKTEYQLSPKSYAFNIVGGGYDEIRRIDSQYELGPGVGTELLKTTNLVWKTEIGFNFQQQYRSDNTTQTAYSVRIAEILAWRVWDKLTADLKVEVFPDLGQLGEYRLRLESNLRYPINNRISLNLDLIDIYDTQPAQNVDPNDMQIRSTIGVTF